MEKIYILGNEQSNIWCSSLGTLLAIPTLSLNDYAAVHDFVVNNVAAMETNARITIDLDATDPALALMIAMHIRLSRTYIDDKALLPILLVSSLPMVTFLSLGECSQFFLAQKGYAFCTPDQAASAVYEVTKLTVDNYKTYFLDRIQIRPDDTTGRHSLANQWGADVLARVTGINYEPNEKIIKARKSLYFKYIISNTSPSISLTNLPHDTVQDVISCKGKKILFIDDEADKGWEDCLRAIFADCGNDDFNVVNTRIADYKDLPFNIRENIKSSYYDLYIIDLRLLGDDEERTIITEQFSGFKLLEQIKKDNRGNQVVFMTASNKAWNLKNLIEKGANGYYIKESPELMLPIDFSKENFTSFKNDVENAFNNKFKRELYQKLDQLQKQIKKSRKFRERGITDELIEKLWKAFMPYMIKIQSKSKNDYASSYLILYGVLEFLKNEYQKDIDKKGNDSMTNIINEIYKQLGNGEELWQEIEVVVTERNDYIHPKEGRTPQIIFEPEGILKLFNVVNKVISSLL